MPDTPRLRRWLPVTALLWMAVINGAMLWNARVEIRQGYGDFSSFYTAGVLVRRGLGAELYNPAAQWKVQQEFAHEVEIRQGPLPYIRPPFEALLFSVFATWPYATALRLWTGLKLALQIGICSRSRNSARPFALHSAAVRSLVVFGVRHLALRHSSAPLDGPQTCPPLGDSVRCGARQMLERTFPTLGDGSSPPGYISGVYGSAHGPGCATPCLPVRDFFLAACD